MKRELCSCGSKKDYKQCCEPIIEGRMPADTAEALMRARYSAFAKVKVQFILDTVLPDKRKENDEETISVWAKNTAWKGLEIIKTEKGLVEDEIGEVEFIAHFLEGGLNKQHHETAKFVKQEGKWFFEDGSGHITKPVHRQAPKVGRNDPCICGSGKKFKKCCGK